MFFHPTQNIIQKVFFFQPTQKKCFLIYAKEMFSSQQKKISFLNLRKKKHSKNFNLRKKKFKSVFFSTYAKKLFV